MNIFLRLRNNITIFLNSISFSVLIMYTPMEGLYAAKFAATFYGEVFSNMLVRGFL